MGIITEKVEIDFTDDQISSSAGSYFISRMSDYLGLPGLLSDNLHLKSRQRGASDAQMLLSLIYCLAQGDGSIVDVDRLWADTCSVCRMFPTTVGWANTFTDSTRPGATLLPILPGP